ncbi:MAG: threonine/serine exporter family protein [Lachnospiraceae bacterium]|nr:threonine/serine exporter family protein [Lachnospiraceae bacterium]
MQKNKDILHLAVFAGEILIKNGGEISRAESTMRHIIESYDIKDYHVYVLSNGIFANIESENSHCCLIRHVAFGGVNLERIAAVNQLSREICSLHYTPKTALKKMESCQKLQNHSIWERSFGSGSGCAAFTLLFGGNILDCLFALCFGSTIQPFLFYCQKKKLSRPFYSIATSAYITLLTILAHILSIPIHVDMVTIGCITPLLPGLTLTNSIRDFFNGDYLSGVIHMIEALLTALCIATGVGFIITLYHSLGGSPL